MDKWRAGLSTLMVRTRKAGLCNADPDSDPLIPRELGERVSGQGLVLR